MTAPDGLMRERLEKLAVSPGWPQIRSLPNGDSNGIEPNSVVSGQLTANST